MELRRSEETEKFVLLRGRYTYMRDIIYSAVPKIFGSPNGISHSAICAEAEKFGSYYTEGYWDYRDYDPSNSKYVLIRGADPLSSNRMIPATIKRFGDILDRAGVAVVDPKLNTSAAKAHEWLPLKPGTDGALASAIAHVILVNGLWSKEFVGDFKDGRNRFRAGAEVDENTFAEIHTYVYEQFRVFLHRNRTVGESSGKNTFLRAYYHPCIRNNSTCRHRPAFHNHGV